MDFQNGFTMIFRTFVAVFVACILAGPAMAQDGITQDGPKLVLPGGDALDPVCFTRHIGEDMDGADGPSNHPVQNCASEGTQHDPANGPHVYDGHYYLTGYMHDYCYLPDQCEEGDVQIERGIIGYRYIGDLNGKMLILTIQNMGGTGNFTTLAYYEFLDIDGQKTLKRGEILAGGDRCNGGISKAEIKDGKIQYSFNLTPYDMVVLGDDPDRASLETLQPYDDLDACAACCYGEAIMQGDTITGMMLNSDGLLDSLKSMSDDDYGPERRKQHCFDQKIVEKLESKVIEFDVKNWEVLTRDIEQNCLMNSALSAPVMDENPAEDEALEP